MIVLWFCVLSHGGQWEALDCLLYSLCGEGDQITIFFLVLLEAGKQELSAWVHRGIWAVPCLLEVLYWQSLWRCIFNWEFVGFFAHWPHFHGEDSVTRQEWMAEFILKALNWASGNGVSLPDSLPQASHVTLEKPLIFFFFFCGSLPNLLGEGWSFLLPKFYLSWLFRVKFSKTT